MKLGVGHLKIFGCLVHFHVSKDKRSKLEAIGKEGIFLGYCDNSKAFRICVPSQRKVELRSNVTFDEDVSLGKAREIPPPPIEKKDDDMDPLLIFG